MPALGFERRALRSELARREHQVQRVRVAPLAEPGGSRPRTLNSQPADAAGANVTALSTLMGHASITVTLDRYGHLLPGTELSAALVREAPERPRTSVFRQRSGAGIEPTDRGAATTCRF